MRAREDDAQGLLLRRTVRRVAALNLGYFGLEFAVALAIGSVSLFADSVDFLEDASINLLILAATAWAPRARARLGFGLAGIILIPGLATIVMAWHRFASETVPAPVVLTVTGLGALAVNGLCTALLLRHRDGGGSLLKAAFLSARNDTIANIAIIGAGLLSAVKPSPWPDLVVGVAIGFLNAGAAGEVLAAARNEHRAVAPEA